MFFLQLSVVGSTMGTRDELERLVRLCVERDVPPGRRAGAADGGGPTARSRRSPGGEVFGKLVLTR